jgi:uncharacterized protein YPO0396
MPFAGELMQVRDDERDWEGAAERLLHSFGLSLLVPDAHYAKVAQWVDDTQLKGRLVYFRVRGNARCRAGMRGEPRCTPSRWPARSPSSPTRRFTAGWSARSRAALTWPAAATQDQFRARGQAITRAGQIKAPGERHEKDDRHRLDDRSRYVLGWSNAAKLGGAGEQGQVLEARLGERWAHRRPAARAISRRRARLQLLAKLEELPRLQRTGLAQQRTELARLAEENAPGDRIGSAADPDRSN